MNQNSYRKSIWMKIASLVWVVALGIGVLLFFFNNMAGAKDVMSEQGLRTAQQAVVRAAITCYAMEGQYPESYDYLKSNYPLAIDETKYKVHYTIFASNLMPDITVVPWEVE